MQRAMFDTVDEVGRVAAAEQIRCDYAKSGQLAISTTETGCERIRALLAELHRSGFSDSDYRWLDASECDARVRMAGARGGWYSPHSAALQPAKLARGLAESIERRGVAIYEHSPARALAPGVVTTDRGSLRARIVLRCTEGYTRNLPGMERELLPLHSLMIVTEPLSDAIWKEIGAADRVLFGDVRRLLTYAQRTADGRIALGAGGSLLLRLRHSRLLLARSGVREHGASALRTTFRCSATSRSPIAGVVCWGFREIRSRSSASTRDPGWARPVATRAVAWPPPIWRAARSPISSRVATPSGSRIHG